MLAAMNTEMKDSHLAAVIKCERKRRNLTQEHLAQLAEVDVRTIQRIERTGSCSAETLMAIAEAGGRGFKWRGQDLLSRRRHSCAGGRPWVPDIDLA